MKKNLFLLFSIYFFVLQPLIIGVLRWQANFFRLGAINLIAIILIGILYNTVENSKEEYKEHEKPLKEAKISFHDHFHSTTKIYKKKSELLMPAIVSFAVAIIIFFMFLVNSGAVEAMLLFSLVLWFIVFMSLTLMFKHRITKSFWALLGTRIYLILLMLSLILTVYDYYQVHKEFQSSFSDYIAQNFFGEDRIPIDGYVYTWEGTIIGTWLGETTGTQVVSSDVFTGISTDSEITEETGTVLGTSIDTLDEPDPVLPTSQGKQKIMDAVIYLVKKYNLPLVTTPNVNFTYVTTKNPYYAERRTAYAHKMIGKDTNPSKYIVCESYIVMKGIAEWWDVSYTSSNVLTQFRNEAVKRNALNGCKKGYIVDAKNL